MCDILMQFGGLLTLNMSGILQENAVWISFFGPCAAEQTNERVTDSPC